MKRRLISILLLVTMLFTMLPAEALAEMTHTVTTTADAAKERKPENPFADVREDSWYYDAVQYARVNGFFNGTSSTTFDPEGPMTRGMFVTVLGRMAGVDQSTYSGQSVFSDVPGNAYYAPYVAWASKYGITSGIGNGKFDPDSLITREQMAVFFVRYFEAFNVDYDTGADITTVPADLESVSPWAREAVLKLWKTGLLAGDGKNFNPTGDATRAQAATLCMRTDKAVETWYSEPGVPSDRVSIDPNADNKGEETGASNNGNKGGSSSGGGSGGGSTTTYYKVTFIIDSNTQEKLYPKDTLLSTLPVPAPPAGKVFLGWYYDAAWNKPVTGEDRLTGNLTLYAKFTDVIELEEGGTPDFVSALDQTPDFSIRVKKEGSAPVAGVHFKFRNISAPDRTPESPSAGQDLVNIEHVKVEGANGVWIITSANGGFTPGHTYQIELISDDIIYDDSADVFGNIKENNSRYDAAQVRFFNFSIESNGVLNLKLNEDLIYVPVSDLSESDSASLMDYAGLYLAAIDNEGNTTYTANNGSGSFTYKGNKSIKVGDTIAVYAGDKPTERLPEKGTDKGKKTDNEEVSYVKITRIDGNENDGYIYYYTVAEAEDVLFKPDILPVDVDPGDGTTGWQQKGTYVVVSNSLLNFSDSKYQSMGLNSETTVDVGDFLAFFTGNYGDSTAQDLAYGKITEIKHNEDKTTTLYYKEVSQAEVMSAMDLYDETQLTEEEIERIIDENKGKIQEIIEAQIMESTFFDEVGEYLAGITIQTEEIKEVFGDNLTLSDCIITYADGTPVGADDLKLMGNIVDKDMDGKKPKVSVSISPKMAHFDNILAGVGFRAEVAVGYEFKIQKEGNDNLIEVELTAFFEQEFTVSFKVSGNAVWKKAWIIPYISDYRLTGHVDLGTYTGLGITATAKLTEDEDNQTWGMPWPNSAKEAAATKKIFTLSESIKKTMKEVEKVLPEDEASASGDLAEKYADFMEDANEEWVDLVNANLLDLRSAVDPFHVLAFGLQVDFVVSANLNVAIGLTFQYENSKRHSFTMLVFGKNAESETLDLSTNGYQFDFYVMGHIGLRAGLRIKVTAGLFSTKLAAIGVQFEAGAYIRLWGYFYYHVENWKVEGVWEKEGMRIRFQQKGVETLRKRSIRVQVWLNKDEKMKLQTSAKKAGLSQETYLRTLINGYVPKELPPTDYYAMMKELHAIGSNLNQIAARANAIGHIDRTTFKYEANRLRKAVLDIQTAVTSPERRVENG